MPISSKPSRTQSTNAHAELTEWVGDDFDPDDDEAEALTAQVALLAKTWSRTPVKKRTRGQ